MGEAAPEGAGTIRAVMRALELLRLMNERQGSGLDALHRASGLPKPTVFRILATLQRAGYVAPDPRPGGYRLTRKVCELSAGFSERSLVVRLAAPIAAAATRRIKWPLAVGTLEADAIVVRYSTMPASPLAVRATTVGHRLPLLESAMGRAYLAFCGEAERQGLTSLLAHRLPRPRGARIETRVAAAVEATRRLGGGLRLPAAKGESATLAVPIGRDDEVLAVLSLTSFGEVMDSAFIERFLPVLREIAAAIAARHAEAETDDATGEKSDS